MARGLHYLDEEHEDDYKNFERINHRPKSKPADQEEFEKTIDKKFRKLSKKAQNLKGFNPL